VLIGFIVDSFSLIITASAVRRVYCPSVHLSQTGSHVHCNNSDISKTVQVTAVIAVDY